jgi:hypothetical protein
VVPEVLRALADGGVTSVRTVPPTLEDAYLKLLGGRGFSV